jgi:Ca2+-binding EF-hand superfamily protein
MQGKTIDEDRLDVVFAEIDLNGDGKIDYSEFIAANLQFEDSMSDKNIRDAFNIFDKDRNGELEVVELREFFGCNKGWFAQNTDKKVQNQIDNFIKQADVDGDGKISFEEFKRIMQNQDHEHMRTMHLNLRE